MKKNLELLARFERGSMTESIHTGHIAVVGAKGSLIGYAGHPGTAVYIRSAAKPLQATAVVASGAAKRFGLTQAEIALMCASHAGEDIHAELAASILAKIGRSEGVLLCPASYPQHKATADRMQQNGEPPSKLRHTCSGKHAGMLAMAEALGADGGAYVSPAHPVQQEMLSLTARLAGLGESRIRLAVDGCGAPVFAMPLDRLAAAYAALAFPDMLDDTAAEAARTVLASIRSEPYLIGGDERFDTLIAQATGGRLIGKMGAEGIYALAAPQERAALAVKISDGAERALYPVVMEALMQLGWLEESEVSALRSFHRPAVRNGNGNETGAIVPDFVLLR